MIKRINQRTVVNKQFRLHIFIKINQLMRLFEPLPNRVVSLEDAKIQAF
jgi:hypothetical protein